MCAAKAKVGEKEWYFFSHRDRKCPRGLRANRATKTGYWKSTGKDRGVFASGSSALIGMKKTLVFYKGRARKGEKTNWAMHEYRLQGKFSSQPLHKNCKDKWVVCRIFKKSSVGMTRSQAYNDLLCYPCFPSLLESPCNNTAENNQRTRSSERQSGTSANVHDVSCRSISMEPNTNLKVHHLHQIRCGSSSNCPDCSDQLSEMAGFMDESSYMHNLMLNAPRIYMNKMSRAAQFSEPTISCDRISAILDQQPGIQQLPGLHPPTLYNQHMPLSSHSSNLGFSTNPYFPSFHSSNAISKVLVDQSAGIPVEPFSSSLSNNNTMGANNPVNSIQWTTDGFCQSILAQPVQEADGDTCLSPYINHGMNSFVCNALDTPLDRRDSSAAPPMDLHSVWNNRELLF
eukprot:PITA_15767